jgi:hypothetical protein
VSALADTRCPECHGDYRLLSATPTRLRKRCDECGHEWSEEPSAPLARLHAGQWVRDFSYVEKPFGCET